MTESLGIDEGAAIHEMAATGEHSTEDALFALTVPNVSAKERTPLTWSSATHWALAKNILG